MSEPVKNPKTAYWLSLGRFIEAFAAIESMMHTLLKFEAETDDKIGNAIFSGVKTDQAKSFINRIRQARGLPEHKRLSEAFSQLTVINKIRNDIVHYGVEDAGLLGFVTSTELVAHTKESIRETYISPRVIEMILVDLKTISAIILIYMHEGDPPREDVEKWRQISLSPWLYIPEPQAPTPKRNPRKRQAHAPRPEA